MARELPIHNGRMTTDLDANGFKIKNLPPGSGFTQVQADWNQADATAPDFIKNKPTIPGAQIQSDWSQSDSTKKDYIKNKPTIPAAVSVDATLTQQGAAADAKVTGDALAQKRGLGDLAVYAPSAFSGWTYTVSPVLPEGAEINIGWGPDYLYPDSQWYAFVVYPFGGGPFPLGGDANSTSLTLTSHFDVEGPEYTVTFTRTVTAWTPVSPADALAKTSQLPTVPSAYTSTPAMDGAGSAGSSTAWARGDHVHPSDTSRAAKTELPYAFNPVIFTNSAATLQDRAVNTLTIAADCTLTLPAVNTNGARDLLLRMDVSYVSGTTLPQITINLPTGETGCAFETDGDSFPVPDAEGAWCYSFTETAQHKFAVSLKSLTTVVQTALGGS